MPSPLLADAFGHHIWATIRVLDACAALDETQLATTVPGTYGSILDALRHIAGADVFYLDVLRGGEAEPFTKAGSDIPTLRAVMEAHDAAWQRLVAGIVIHVQYGPAKTRREEALMEHIGPAYGQALQSGFPSLIARLEAELAARDADRGPEPALATPSPGGPLSELQPLTIVG